MHKEEMKLVNNNIKQAEEFIASLGHGKNFYEQEEELNAMEEMKGVDVICKDGMCPYIPCKECPDCIHVRELDND